MNTENPVLNICQYTVKPGKEAELERLLSIHWPALHGAGLVTEDRPQIFKGLPSTLPGGEHGADRVYFEIFSWKSANSPQLAHQMPAVMAVWEPMGAICEKMDFPSFTPLDLVTI